MEINVAPEHNWLKQLLGTWAVESEMECEPGKPPMKSKGTDRVRALGDLWILCEGTGEVPDGGTHHSLMTLGFDPAKNLFVGTFIASVMTHLWPYSGTLNAAKTILTLDSEGPNMDTGGTAKYQDMIEIVAPDHRILRSQIQVNGEWKPFMQAHYHKIK